MLTDFRRINISTHALAFIVGLGLTGSLITIAFNNVIHHEKEIFNGEVTLIKDSIFQKLNATEEVAHGIRTLFYASTSVEADEFRIISEDILSRHDFLLSTHYMPLILDQERASFEASMHEKGFITFAITTQRDEKLILANQQQRYFPVLYLEPFSPRTSRQIGLDYFSMASHKPYIQSAIDSAATSTSPPDTAKGKSSYMTYFALYTGKKTPDNLTERQQTVNGLIGLRIDSDKLFEGVTDDQHYTLSLKARDAINNKHWGELAAWKSDHTTDHEETSFRVFNSNYELQVGNHNFSVGIKKVIHFENTRYMPVVISAITGVLLTLLLIGLSWIISKRSSELQNRNREIEETVKIRTQELAAANERLEQSADELKREKEEQQTLIAKLQQTQSQLLQSEKMASIGQLAAGVAHEINNPIGFVNSNLGSLQQYVNDLLRLLDVYEQSCNSSSTPEAFKSVAALAAEIDVPYLKEDLIELVSESQEGLDRVTKIVQNLKDFSHVDQAEWQHVDIHKGLDSTLNIVNNELRYKADIIKVYGDIPAVECMPSQLNQVIMNLLVNAGHAIEERGTITLSTGSSDDMVWIEIEDNGKGISLEDQKRIFDPFFTTKPIGKGMGLGLSVSFGIIEKHRGRIDVESEEGKGTRFRLWLPIKQPELSEA